MLAYFQRRKDEARELRRLRVEVAELREELSAAKRLERFQAILTLVGWGKEAFVDMMRAPP